VAGFPAKAESVVGVSNRWHRCCWCSDSLASHSESICLKAALPPGFGHRRNENGRRIKSTPYTTCGVYYI
jgi:hypothetical protein